MSARGLCNKHYKRWQSHGDPEAPVGPFGRRAAGPASEKECGDCGVVKSLDEFHRQAKGLYGRQQRCKPCESKRTKVWHEANAERTRDRHFQRSYGITVEEYDQLFNNQGGACAICRQPERRKNSKPSGGVQRLVVDHDHQTGQVRGLLCHACNSAIGLLLEDTSILRDAINYLEGNK